MQLRKTLMMLTALSALSVVMTGCPGDEERILRCATDGECNQGEICHPTAKACVQTCATNDECSTRKCEAVSTSVATKVCKCTTDQLCTSDLGTELLCSTLDTVCTPKCTADVDCGTGRTCDTATGQCKAGGGNTGTTCTGEGQTTCAYGQFCSASKCTAVPAPTCANFNPSQGGKTPVWNATSSTGPIIFDVTQVSFANDSFCSGAGEITAKARVKAYVSTGTFPAQKDALSGLFYVRVNGSEVSGTNLIRPSEYAVSADGKTATFTMNFCPGASATTLSVGIYFTGGNETCAQLTKP